MSDQLSVASIARRGGQGERSVITHAQRTSHPAYWPQIDGLRAVAILLVVLFHAGIPHLRGGFIGVDVFFVISGFLITGLLAKELSATGRIDLLDFYARRARRLLPALAAVLVATLIAGAVILTPIGEQQALAQSAIAASALLANLYFWRTQSSYFAGPSEELPLLHLWTLSVEEQFYAAWPLVMIVIAIVARRAGRNPLPWIVTALVAAGGLSLLACWALTSSRTLMTFYMTPFRVWEFAVGALLAFATIMPARPGPGRLAGRILTAGGLGAIIAAAMLFGSSTAFPGIAAALPALGAGAVIAGILIAPQGWPARLLGSAPLAAIGKVSYSWYLWHWPLLALARADALGQASLRRDVGLVILALGLAALTYRFVEEPVRRRRTWAFQLPARSVAAGIALLGVVAGTAGALWAMADRSLGGDPVLRTVSAGLAETRPLPVTCEHFRFPFAGLAPAVDCTLGAPATAALQHSPLVVLWGDSHAYHFIPGLALWAEKHGIRLLPRTMGACKPYIASVPEGASARQRAFAESCIAFNAAVFQSLRTLKSDGASTIVLAARWSVPSTLEIRLGTWNEALKKRVAALRELGFRVVLFAEVPGARHAAPPCVVRLGDVACSRRRREVDTQRAAMLAALHGAASPATGVSVWDPVDELCGRESCPVLRDGVVLYSDAHHLSVAGSLLLAPALATALGQPLTGGLN